MNLCDGDKVEIVRTRITTNSLRDDRSFSSLVGYYPKCIPELSAIAEELSHLAKRSVQFQKDTTCQKAFDELQPLTDLVTVFLGSR